MAKPSSAKGPAFPRVEPYVSDLRIVVEVALTGVLIASSVALHVMYKCGSPVESSAG